jgi:hypothetical protein
LSVTSADINQQRVMDVNAVRVGGISRLTTLRMVLEHMPDPATALKQAVPIARRFVILSVPSVPDDNPEHIHLFSPDQILAMV